MILNGVDLAEFRPAGPRDRIHARKLLGLDDVPDRRVRGRADGAEGAAGPPRRLAARSGPGCPRPSCVLVGDGPDRRALERLADGLPGVTFAGARTDVPLWMAAADVVVVPSRWEGMALVPLEAMACARSVVATDVNGVVDSVPPGAGAIVPLDDPQALSRGAGRTGSSTRQLADEEGWHGRSHVETHHDVTDVSA